MMNKISHHLFKIISCEYRDRLYTLLAVIIWLAGQSMVHAADVTDLLFESKKDVHILCVHSYSPDYQWTKNQHQGFVQLLKQHQPLNIHVSAEYMDTKLITVTQKYQKQLVDLIRDKYEEHTPDLIYVTDDNALVFALDYISSLYPDVPVFFSGVNNYAVLKYLNRRQFTGVFERKDAVRNIKLLNELQSDAGLINIVGDESETFAAIRQEITSDMAEANLHIPVNYIVGNNIEYVVSKLKSNENHPVLLTTVGKMKNEAGQLMNLKLIIDRIRENTGQLILAMEDAYMFPGVQGGYVTDGQRQGETAAEMVVAWLAGKSIENIEPVTESPNEYIFNESALYEVGKSVPINYLGKAKIIEPLPDFFERYRSAIISIIVILSGALLFTAFLLMMNMGDRYDHE